MDLFGMGPMEIVLIFAVALLVFGPERLPQVLGTVGKTLRQIRQVTDEITREVTRELNVEDSKQSPPAYTPPITPPPVYTPPASTATPNGAASLPAPEAIDDETKPSAVSLEKPEPPAEPATADYIQDDPAPDVPVESQTGPTDALDTTAHQSPSPSKAVAGTEWVAFQPATAPVGFQRRGVDTVVNFDDPAAVPTGDEPESQPNETNTASGPPPIVLAEPGTENAAPIESSPVGERRDS